VFSHLFDLSILSAPDARRAHILSLLEDEDEIMPLASLLNAVLPLDLPETEATSQMSGLVRADATRALLLRLLQDSVARSPKLLVLEDAHWFDSASWALALAVSQSIQPLLLIMTMRPSTSDSHHTIVAEYQQLAAAAQVRMVLDALAPDHAITLVCQRLGVAALPEPVAALIREKAQGNPFFSEELAFALRDAGLLRIDGDQCQLAPDADLRALSFPETVQGAIISRIDRLAPTQQLTLKVASVIGRVFPVRTLEAVYPINIVLGKLSDDLATLARLDITPLDAIEPELAYSFKHAITQDVVYNLMLFAQRRQLHRAVAEWYERAYADDLAWLYPLLAYHWGKAGVVARALDYFEHAGRHALSMSAVREARALAEQGLALIGSTGPESMEREPFRQMHLTSLLGEAHQQLGEFMAARTVLERSLALARSLSDHNGISDALSLLGRVATDIGAYAEARRCLEEGRDLASAAGERMRVAQALSNLGNVGMRQGTYAESERNYQDALAIFSSLGHRPGVALVLNGLGNNAVDRGENDVATYCYEESLAIRRTLGDRWGISSTLSNLGWVAHLQHDYAAARAYYEESLLIARAIGDQRGKAIVLNNLGFTDYALGDDRAAAACFDEALAVATTIGAIPLVLELLVGIARLLARAGQPTDAVELLGLALAHPAVNTDVRTQAELFLGELGDSLAAVDLAQALERGKERDLTETVAELIHAGRGVHSTAG
jgi:tetratricopeptide (TPR) repeat protein